MILVGDIGGTNARFAIAIQAAGKKIVISDYEKFKSRDFPDFSDLVQSFIDSIDHKPGKAILAVAGPVQSGKVGSPISTGKLTAPFLSRHAKFHPSS